MALKSIYSKEVTEEKKTMKNDINKKHTETHHFKELPLNPFFRSIPSTLKTTFNYCTMFEWKNLKKKTNKNTSNNKYYIYKKEIQFKQKKKQNSKKENLKLKINTHKHTVKKRLQTYNFYICNLLSSKV